MTVALNPRFSFDTFVIGPANRLAGTAARAVAESPGAAYNPLLVYGPSGLGKTHLLMAIAQLAQRLAPHLRVEYVTLDEFMEGHNAAHAAGQSEAFRNRFAGVDLLLVDDIQFLAGRAEAQSELLRIVGQLQTEGRQVVLTSDCAISEITNLDERVVQRLDGGLVVDIGPPDAETRRAILQRWSTERGAAFLDGVLEAAADYDVANVRELLGLLNRLIAFQAVSDQPLTPEAARGVLEGHAPRGAAPGVATPAEMEGAGPDEFAAFLSGVASTVTEQVEAWRSRLGEAILRWEAEGYRTARLEALVAQDVPQPGEQVVQAFERDIERLQTLQRKMEAIDPERAQDAVFYDPDRVREAQALLEAEAADLAPPPGPSEAWSFESFLAGEANRVVRTALEAVIAAPGTRYNPLVVVGPTGVGKTHLLHALGHGLAGTLQAFVACLSAQQFADELAQAMDRNRVDVWRSRYLRVGALLLDDLQILAERERSQEELFLLFDALSGRGAQLAFTLPAPPRDVPGLDERIISRLEGGLVAEVGPPDRELRRAIIIRKLEERLGAAEEDLADYLAARPADSVRAVVGLVQRVLNAAEGQGVVVDAAFARTLIEGAPPPRRRSSVRVRTSGVLVSPTSGVKSREKMVWNWPDPAERLIEELA